jgi:hypothetical protein
LLNTEVQRLEGALGGGAPDGGARDAAITDWLSSRLVPLVEQALSATQDGESARAEARQANAAGLTAALDELRKSATALREAGMELRTARPGDTQRPEAGVKLDYADAGKPADTILEVRQPGWSWKGRLLRPMHVVVQEESAASPSGASDGRSGIHSDASGGFAGRPVVETSFTPSEPDPGPRTDDAPRVKRL